VNQVILLYLLVQGSLENPLDLDNLVNLPVLSFLESLESPAILPYLENQQILEIPIDIIKNSSITVRKKYCRYFR
jgi:hypothetical protein